MFRLSAYPAPVLRWRQGPVMSGFLNSWIAIGMRRRASPPWRSCVGPTGSSAPGAPGGWLSTGGSTAGFRMCRLRAAAFGDRRDGLAPHPHAIAQMVRGGMADRARQARRLGSVPGARTGAALRDGLADGAQVAPRAERAAGIPARRPDRDR